MINAGIVIAFACIVVGGHWLGWRAAKRDRDRKQRRDERDAKRLKEQTDRMPKL